MGQKNTKLFSVVIRVMRSGPLSVHWTLSVFSGCTTPIIEDGYFLIRKCAVDEENCLWGACSDTKAFLSKFLSPRVGSWHHVLSRPGLGTLSPPPPRCAHGVSAPAPAIHRCEEACAWMSPREAGKGE